MRLVFMGTPALVLPVLDGLAADPDLQVVGVYTQPDRPRGRGRTPEMPPVKSHALSLGLPVYQPASLRPARAQAELAALQPQVIVVAAYGLFLPPPVLNTPAHGCLNLHPSLLPRYRGPSPVVTAILEGDTVTGVTLMLLDQGMDTGPIIAQRQHPIGPEDTAESLTLALFQLGAALLLETLPGWVAGRVTAHAQDAAQATVTRKVERADGQARWELSAAGLERRRRAYTPWPGLFTHWQGQVLKLLDVAALPPQASPGAQPGLVVPLALPGMPAGIGTAEGMLGLKTLQLEGRRPVSAAEFLRGYPQFLGSRL
ncbi:MAG TPA: methionyl-tRNA formyltransferase [Dehalococcoidia bacterium]|nr:methionyl-tRNA formyltransferase [Dehalococcoidia bacterium]